MAQARSTVAPAAVAVATKFEKKSVRCPLLETKNCFCILDVFENFEFFSKFARLNFAEILCILPEFCQNSPKLAGIQNPDTCRTYPELSGRIRDASGIGTSSAESSAFGPATPPFFRLQLREVTAAAARAGAARRGTRRARAAG